MKKLAKPRTLPTFWCECIWNSKWYIKIMFKKSARQKYIKAKKAVQP